MIYANKKEGKKMNIKRLVAAILAFLALASFAGCKGEKKDNSTSTSAEAAGAQASETESGADTEPTSEAAETQKASTESVKMNPRTNTPYYFLDLDMESFGSNEWNNWVPISEGDYVNGKYVIRDEYFYDKIGNLTGTRYRDDKGEAQFYSENFKYNSDGTVKSCRDKVSGQAYFVYKYDSQKRVIEKERHFDDGVIYKYTYSYDSSGRLTEFAELHQETSGETTVFQKVTLTYDKNGNIISSQEIFGDASNFTYLQMEYDSHNNMIQRKLRSSNGSWVTVEKDEYDSRGNLIKQEYYDEKGAFRACNTMEYDKNNCIVKYTHEDAEPYVFRSVRQNDQYGNPVKISNYSGESKDKLKLEEVFKLSYKYEKNRVTVTQTTLMTNGEKISADPSMTVYEYRSHAPLMTFEDTKQYMSLTMF